jgi:hypothetical protein
MKEDCNLANFSEISSSDYISNQSTTRKDVFNKCEKTLITLLRTKDRIFSDKYTRHRS